MRLMTLRRARVRHTRLADTRLIALASTAVAQPHVATFGAPRFAARSRATTEAGGDGSCLRVLSRVLWEGHAAGFAALGWLIGVLTANAGVNELVIGVVVLLVVCLLASGTSRSQRTEAGLLY
jgi:hypothetical protein